MLETRLPMCLHFLLASSVIVCVCYNFVLLCFCVYLDLDAFLFILLLGRISLDAYMFYLKPSPTCPIIGHVGLLSHQLSHLGKSKGKRKKDRLDLAGKRGERKKEGKKEGASK